MDKILISGIRVETIIGTLPREKTQKQEICIDLVLETDMHRAGATDDLMDAVDYSAVEKAVHDLAESSACSLLEHLAQKIADCCLRFPLVQRVTVRIEKPAAPVYAKSIAVEIMRGKE